MGGDPRARLWRVLRGDRVERERQVDRVRALLAAPLFVINLIVPMTAVPAQNSRPLLAGYAALAIAANHTTRGFTQHAHLFVRMAAAADVSIGAWLFAFGSGPSSAVVLLFGLCAAAHRRGFLGAGAGALMMSALLIVIPVGVGALHLETVLPASDATTVLEQCAFVIFAGLAIGYFAEPGRRRPDDDERLVASAAERLDVRAGLRQTVAVTFDTFTRLFEAQRAIALVRDVDSGDVFLWERGDSAGAPADSLRVRRVSPQTLSAFVAIKGAICWSARRRDDSGRRFDVVAIDDKGTALAADDAVMSHPLATALGPCADVMCFSAERPREWSGQILVIDSRTEDRRAALELGARLVRRLTPAFDRAYLLHRIRAKSAGNERRRIARELHDGIVQSVMSVQIQLRTLASRPNEPGNPLGNELNRLAHLLQSEVVELRELMQQMQKSEIASDELVDALAEIVRRFEYESGIAAQFITQLDTVALSPRACCEVARIVQGALVNVRKHSGAGTVTVRFLSENGNYRLLIDDDGRGFPFSGRLSQKDLEFGGPHVMSERVRLLGGTLAVESVPNHGARIDIVIPVSRHAVAG